MESPIPPVRLRDQATQRFMADAEAPDIDPAKIKARRKALDLRQDEVAAHIGVSQSHVSFIESGRRRPSLHTLQLIAKALDCAIDDFAPAGAA